MKSTWAFVVITFAVSNALDQDFIDDFMEQLQEVGEKCAEEVHATSDDIAELVARQIPPSSHEGKCMIFCVQKNFNMMKADGGLNRAGAVAALKPLQKVDPALHQKVLKIFVACGMKVKPVSDPCETATLLAVCAKNEAESVGLDKDVGFLR